MDAAQKSSHQTTYLKDYQKPSHLISQVHLHFDLYEEKAIVKSRLQLERQDDEECPLKLHGEKLKLLSVKVDGELLQQDAYEVDDNFLVILNLPQSFCLEIETEIEPQNNHALEGLYKSGDIFCTQNESEGFRKITYYLDRPDVMAKYTTTITADKSKYPVLLSNGNPVDQGNLEEGRHFAKWEDPFPKPCYLFALVAGDLAMVKSSFTTLSGREIDLRIYVEHGNEGKCEHAMDSLKNAMKWDEDTFGLECDLDTYMVVAVNDFNFGAMENKGLNIFNSQYVLANPKTATDANYQGIEGVIGHEYFHNWTGNRVTCRDWFQITLKEGLTVFRDQEFSSDMGARAVKRISDVRVLRDYQFVEDAGPNAHPIQPKSYVEINNFYTMTVYQKGAEIIRMIHTLIGKDNFRKGMDKYFELYDGQAVTVHEFVNAMELASGHDLTQFKLWYDQAGTPQCQVGSSYDADQKTYTLTVRQNAPKVPKIEGWKPFYFPLVVGLIDKKGAAIDLILEGENVSPEKNKVLIVSEAEQSFTFKNVEEEPVPSLLRNFSAPYYMHYDYQDEDLAFLLRSDEDPFNQFEAGQRLAHQELRQLIGQKQKGESLSINEGLLSSFGELLKNEDLDPAFRAEVLLMPSLTTLVEEMDVCDYESAFAAREWFVRSFAEQNEKSLLDAYHSMRTPGPYQIDSVSIAKRALKNRALAFLVGLEREEYILLAYKQFSAQENMTDQIAALSLLCNTDTKQREDALEQFYDTWKNDPLVMNKWFAVQAASKSENVLDHVKSLEKHQVFDIKNPNKVRSLLGMFGANLVRFHDASGQGYKYVADKVIEIDTLNPSGAAHLSGAFKKYAKMDSDRKALMKSELSRILDKEGLSPNTFEIVSKTLQQDS